MSSGLRVWQCELSLVDTTLLIAGIVTAGRYFEAGGNEAEIRALSNELYQRVDWRWAQSEQDTVSQGWKPECGFLHYGWEGYNEATIVYVLGMGSPMHTLSAASFAGWTSTYQWENLLGQDVLYSGPLFTHMFSHAWIDYRGIRDSFMREKHSDYFENSKRTIAIHREYGARNPRGYEGYDRDLWGITAGDGPGNRELRQSSRDRRFFGYMSRGAPYGPDDGTIARLSTSLHSGSVLQRIQSDLGGSRQYLAFRWMVWTRSGTSGHDDRKPSQRAHLGNNPRLRIDPRGTRRRGL